MSPFCQYLILGVLTAGIILAVVITLWLTSAPTITTYISTCKFLLLSSNNFEKYYLQNGGCYNLFCSKISFISLMFSYIQVHYTGAVRVGGLREGTPLLLLTNFRATAQQMKIVKNRLRVKMSDERLNSLLLCTLEAFILDELSNHELPEKWIKNKTSVGFT